MLVNDFRIIIQVKGGKVGVEADDEKIKTQDLASTCGILQILTGGMAMRQGNSLDEVKDSMWDIYQWAMQKLMDKWEEMELWDD